MSRLVLLAIFICVPGCNDRKDDKPVGDIVALFGNVRSLDAIKKAPTVRAYLLTVQDENDLHRRSISEFRSTEDPSTVLKAFNTELKEVLLNPATYLWDEANACTPNYGIRIQFLHDNQQVDILVCFQCNFLAIFEDGDYTGRQDFTPAGRRRFLIIAKKLFPNDNMIQSLD